MITSEENNKEKFFCYDYPETVMLTLWSNARHCKLFFKWFKLLSATWVHLSDWDIRKRRKETLVNLDWIFEGTSFSWFLLWGTLFPFLWFDYICEEIIGMFCVWFRYPARLRRRVCVQVNFIRPCERWCSPLSVNSFELFESM